SLRDERDLRTPVILVVEIVEEPRFGPRGRREKNRAPRHEPGQDRRVDRRVVDRRALVAKEGGLVQHGGKYGATAGRASCTTRRKRLERDQSPILRAADHEAIGGLGLKAPRQRRDLPHLLDRP